MSEHNEPDFRFQSRVQPIFPVNSPVPSVGVLLLSACWLAARQMIALLVVVGLLTVMGLTSAANIVLVAGAVVVSAWFWVKLTRDLRNARRRRRNCS